VQAGGYNSYHETRRFGLPALFYPNMNTGMDDQLARCNVSSQEGWGIVVENRTEENIANGVKSLLALKTIDLPKQKNGADVLSVALNK
jgi:predicted glycosyltransferase